MFSFLSGGITESCGSGAEKRRILSVIRKRNPATSPEDAKRKDAPVPESKVISLGKRAEDAEKPFFEQLLQEGARKLLQAAIENEVIDYIQFHKDRRGENGQLIHRRCPLQTPADEETLRGKSHEQN